MQDKRKVLLISLRSDTGGGPKHMADLLDFLKECPNYAIYTASPERPPFFDIFKNCEGHFSLPHRSFSFSKFASLFKFIKKNQIELVHTHGRGAGFYGALLGILGVKVVHTFHGIDQSRGLSALIKRVSEKLLYQFINRFIAVSASEKEIAEQLLLINANKIETIPNGINIPPVFDQHVTLHPTLTLGSLARLDPVKNVEELIRFVAYMAPYEKVKLIIAGPGDQAPLKALTQKLGVQEQVHFLGEISDQKSFFDMIDLYISSSRREGLPYSLLEAMAYMKPIVASNVSGHCDLLEKDALYEIGNLQNFQKKFLNVKNNVNKHIEANYKKLQKDHDITVQLRKISKLYEAIE